MRHHKATTPVHVGAECIRHRPVGSSGPDRKLVARILIVLAQSPLQVCGSRAVADHSPIRIIVTIVQNPGSC